MSVPPSSNSKKRQRQNSSASNDNTNADDPFPPLDLKPFNCTRKLKDMDPNILTSYFPQLPEKTQYFDMGRILENKLQGKPYYTEDLIIWREIRPFAEAAHEYFCTEPSYINKPGNVVPLSNTEMALRGAATYHGLLGSVNLRLPSGDEGMERLALAIARKTMDYILISYTLCSLEKINFYLPGHKEWFEDARITMQRWTQTITQPATRSVPTPKMNDRSGTNEGLDYQEIVDSMILSRPAGTVEEEWNKIVGLKAEKWSIYSAMVLNYYNRLTKAYDSTNFVLFGPPGTGKSMMWKAAAAFDGWTVFDVTGDAIQQTYLGQSDKVIKTLFERARQRQPACIVIDEADWLLSQRTSHQSERAQTIRSRFLKGMSDVMHDHLEIMFIATTNRPADFHEGFLRRFHNFIYIGLPDRGAISKILQAELAVYDRHEDVTNAKLNDLATDIAQRRTLSADDVTRAIGQELCEKLESPWSTADHFREETGKSGEKSLVPCGPNEPGAFKCSIYEMTEDQICRLKRSNVRMADVRDVLWSTKAVTSRTKLKEYEVFNESKGKRMF